MEEQRQIFLHGPLGQRHLREILSAQFSGLILYPEPIWLISPWMSDFDVIDNRGGQWSFLDPSWGPGWSASRIARHRRQQWLSATHRDT